MPTSSPPSNAPLPRRLASSVLVSLVLVASGGQAAAEEPDADVVAVRMVSSGPEALLPLVSDLKRIETLWPEGCTRKWVHGDTSQGVGATAELVYTMGLMRRKLDVSLSRVEEGMVELDHGGDRGFYTRFNISPGELGTTVEMHTYLHPPPKPFLKLYFNRIQPKWRGCQEGLLENLALVAVDGG